MYEEEYNERLNRVLKDMETVRFMDDDYARLFFYNNIRAVQLILRIIMNKPNLLVKSVKVQEEFEGSDGSHGVRFDVYAVDIDGTQYDIEIQKVSSGASPYRADYNSAMMTVNTLKSGEGYSALADRERVVIFITLHDVMGGNLPLYTVKRVCLETGKEFGDGTSIIYLNTAHKDYTTAIGKLIHDLRCKKAKDIYYGDLAETAKSMRGEEEGGQSMESVKALKETIKKQGRAEGRAEAQKNIALSLLKLGQNALKDIAEVCQLTLEQVQELAATVQAQ